jgi:hypothetical protein
MLRWLLLPGLLLCAAANCFAATPAIDASGPTLTQFNSASSGSIAVTTTSTNDLIMIFVQTTRRSTSAATITGITGASLSWANRANRQDAYVGSCFAFNNCFGDVEIWWACSPSALTASSMTVNLNQSADEVALIAFGVTGICPSATPFDTNVGLPIKPAANTGTSGSNVQGVASTSQNSDLIFIVMGSGQNHITGTEACSGWQQYGIIDSSGPNDYASVQVTAKGFNTTQAGLTVSAFGGTCSSPANTSTWAAMVDAVTNGVPVSSGGTRTLMGAGQ